MKRQNSLELNPTYIGLNYGDHGINPDSIISDLRRLLSGTANLFVVRCAPQNPLMPEAYRSIAQFARDEGMAFAILYAYQHPPKDRRSHLDKEVVRDIKEIAGDLFLGEIFAEIGSQSCSQDVGYYVEMENEKLIKPEQDFSDMSAARKRYVRLVREMIDYDHSIGIDNTIMVEPTAISAYDLEGGIDVPILEVLPGDTEKLIPFTRGAAISYGKKHFGGFVAHEWYGGYRHDDELKRKRLDIVYKYLYMQGASYVVLESGNTEIASFGYTEEYDSETCRFYRDTAKRFYDFYTENPRPSCGPYTKVAFVFGEDDGYADFLGGSAWCQFGREEWGRGDAENSWKILSEVYRPFGWQEQEGFAFDGADLSGAPAYGSYDVIAAAAPLGVLREYDSLIFVGHNTMSSELYRKLCDYVEGGGILLMAASHLSTDSSRTGKREYINGGDFSELFGVKIAGYERKNQGAKFKRDSIVKNLKYPGTLDFECDANYPGGYADYARLDLCGAESAAVLCDSFFAPTEDATPLLTEYKKGAGAALLFSFLEYPGAAQVYPIYRIVVKALLCASHADAEIKVYGSDRVRFSVLFEDGGERKLYLLNTAFDVPSSVIVATRDRKETVTLDPCELKILDI